MDELERFWGNMLSRDPARIRETWDTLQDDEKQAVRTHLQRMTTENGWTEPQRLSAQTALQALDDDTGDDLPGSGTS